MSRLLIVFSLLWSVSRPIAAAAETAPNTDATLAAVDLYQLAAAAAEAPAANSPLAIVGVTAQGPVATNPGPTSRKAIDESRDRCQKAGLLGADGKVTPAGQGVWRALASPQLAIQAKRISREGIGAIWYGVSDAQAWALAPQKDGGFRIFGPFPREGVESLLAARLALPDSQAASQWNESFALFDWMALLCIERERIAALAPEAGGNSELGVTAEQVASGLVTPRALSILSGDPTIDPTDVMKQLSDPAGAVRLLDGLVDRGFVDRARAGSGPVRYRLSARGAELARQVFYPRQTLQITAIAPRGGAKPSAATAQFCSSAEGRAIVRYLPASRQFTVSSIPAGDAKDLFVETLRRVIGEATATPLSQPATARATTGPASGPLLGDVIREELGRSAFRTASAVRTRRVWGRDKDDLWLVSIRPDKRIDVEYEDTDGDGAPDFVRVRDYPDGPFTRSFILRDGKWEESNILEAYLEVTFKLPWDRSAYHKHDVNVILNDHVIAQLTDVIPQGLYRFPVRPQNLKIGADSAHPNDVRLETLHLRGGHYVVSSDFDLTIRTSQVSRYVVADDPQEAQKVLRESAQLRSAGVDLALYANAFRTDPVAPRADEVTTIRGEVHNVGMEVATGWKLRVHDGDPTKGGTLIAETPLAPVDPGDALPVEQKWQAKPGEHLLYLTLVVPSDVKAQRQDNKQVSVDIVTGGDTEPPALLIAEPAEGAALAAGKITFNGTATDNVAVAALEYNVDGGLWSPIPLKERWEISIDLPKGDHRITVRARDTSGLTTEQARQVKCN
jgi:hypothetical protein